MGHRALPLLIAVAVPALAFGQTAGQLTANPSEVGQSKCASTSTTDELTLSWTINTSNTGRSAIATDTYMVAVYASGTACPDANVAPAPSATNVVAKGVAVSTTTPNTQTTSVTFSAMAAASAVTCPAPLAPASDDAEVLCVYLVDSTGVAVGGTNGAAATGTFLFQLARPPAPVLNSVDPGNGALTANFQAGTSGTPDSLDIATSDSYRVDVHLAGALVASITGTSSPIRVELLTNGTTYDVDVVAFSPSPASNQSAASNSIQGTPLQFDSFWTRYQNAGGREQGGCGGGAGALSLLALLPLALRRRRP